MKYSREKIFRTVHKKGYRYFIGNAIQNQYDVNIIGVRNSDTKYKVTNKFDDILTISYKDELGRWKYHEYDCTTDPGTHWVKNVLKKSGVAVLRPGQYIGSHCIGQHKGVYEALTQKLPVIVYRDNDRDDEYNLDEGKTETGIFGINIHRATKHSGKKSTQIDKWSAGCQVIAGNDDWKEFMEICNKAVKTWGNSFTYTLIESDDIKKWE
jgi:hypothetical protein